VNGSAGPPEGTGRIRVGLLLCDHLDPDVAAVAGDYTDLYPAVYEPHGLDLRVYEVTRGEFPVDLDECDVWMTSGSRRSAVDDEPWIHQVRDLIARLAAERRPHVGICFGHQLTALALGGEVGRAAAGWGVGGRTFDVVAPAPWMDDDDRFTLIMSHQDQVLRLPDGATLVAGAEYCSVGAYRVDDHVFCVQGHPEFVPEVAELLMEKRRAVIGDDVVEAGLASLGPGATPIDRDRVARWIADFYRRALSAD
jgi:GMP synthase-like glutamine amidotransferase